MQGVRMIVLKIFHLAVLSEYCIWKRPVVSCICKWAAPTGGIGAAVFYWGLTDREWFKYSSGFAEDLWLLAEWTSVSSGAGPDYPQSWGGSAVYLNNLIRLTEQKYSSDCRALSGVRQNWCILRPTTGNEKTSVHTSRENISQVIKSKSKPLFVGSLWEINKHKAPMQK